MLLEQIVSSKRESIHVHTKRWFTLEDKVRDNNWIDFGGY